MNWMRSFWNKLTYRAPRFERNEDTTDAEKEVAGAVKNAQQSLASSTQIVSRQAARSSEHAHELTRVVGELVRARDIVQAAEEALKLLARNP